MKTKKIMSLLLAVVMIASVCCVSASAAEPNEIAPLNNHTDTEFTFSFPGLGLSNTEGRAKQDASGTYIKAYTMCNGGFNVYVDGYNTSGGSWDDCTDKDTRGQPRLSSANTPYLISQWVYERGYRTARLGGFKFLGTTVTGVWSPDSEGDFPYLGSKT